MVDAALTGIAVDFLACNEDQLQYTETPVHHAPWCRGMLPLPLLLAVLLGPGVLPELPK